MRFVTTSLVTHREDGGPSMSSSVLGLSPGLSPLSGRVPLSPSAPRKRKWSHDVGDLLPLPSLPPIPRSPPSPLPPLPSSPISPDTGAKRTRPDPPPVSIRVEQPHPLPSLPPPLHPRLPPASHTQPIPRPYPTSSTRPRASTSPARGGAVPLSAGGYRAFLSSLSPSQRRRPSGPALPPQLQLPSLVLARKAAALAARAVMREAAPAGGDSAEGYRMPAPPPLLEEQGREEETPLSPSSSLPTPSTPSNPTLHLSPAPSSLAPPQSLAASLRSLRQRRRWRSLQLALRLQLRWRAHTRQMDDGDGDVDDDVDADLLADDPCPSSPLPTVSTSLDHPASTPTATTHSYDPYAADNRVVVAQSPVRSSISSAPPPPHGSPAVSQLASRRHTGPLTGSAMLSIARPSLAVPPVHSVTGHVPPRLPCVVRAQSAVPVIGGAKSAAPVVGAVAVDVAAAGAGGHRPLRPLPGPAVPRPALPPPLQARLVAAVRPRHAPAGLADLHAEGGGK